MSTAYDTVGVCLRCARVEFNLDGVHVCPDCRKGWQLMGVKDALYLLGDALRVKRGEQSVAGVEWLKVIAQNGGQTVDGKAWTGSHCAEVARIGMKRISEAQETKS